MFWRLYQYEICWQSVLYFEKSNRPNWYLLWECQDSARISLFIRSGIKKLGIVFRRRRPPQWVLTELFKFWTSNHSSKALRKNSGLISFRRTMNGSKKPCLIRDEPAEWLHRLWVSRTTVSRAWYTVWTFAFASFFLQSKDLSYCFSFHILVWQILNHSEFIRIQFEMLLYEYVCLHVCFQLA